MSGDLEQKLADAVSAATVVRPGDLLVVAIDRPIGSQQAEEMSTRLARVLPEGAQCAIVQATSLAVARAKDGGDE